MRNDFGHAGVRRAHAVEPRQVHPRQCSQRTRRKPSSSRPHFRYASNSSVYRPAAHVGLGTQFAESREMLLDELVEQRRFLAVAGIARRIKERRRAAGRARAGRGHCTSPCCGRGHSRLCHEERWMTTRTQSLRSLRSFGSGGAFAPLGVGWQVDRFGAMQVLRY